MCITGSIVIVEDDDVSASQLRGVALVPFWRIFFLLYTGGTMRVARRGNAKLPEIVRILLAFDDANDPAGIDRFSDFIDAIEDSRVDTFDPLFPAAFPIRLFEPEARLATGLFPHLAEARDPRTVAIDVARQLGPAAAAPFRRSCHQPQ